jgi:hypothetical protein
MNARQGRFRRQPHTPPRVDVQYGSSAASLRTTIIPNLASGQRGHESGKGKSRAHAVVTVWVMTRNAEHQIPRSAALPVRSPWQP